jgi:hypothetical protein
MAESFGEAAGQLGSFGESLGRRVQERPWPVLGLAAMAGYVVGGGLFSSWTRPLARAAMGALLVPGVRQRLRGLAGELRGTQPTGAA